MKAFPAKDGSTVAITSDLILHANLNVNNTNDLEMHGQKIKF